MDSLLPARPTITISSSTLSSMAGLRALPPRFEPMFCHPNTMHPRQRRVDLGKPVCDVRTSFLALLPAETWLGRISLGRLPPLRAASSPGWR